MPPRSGPSGPEFASSKQEPAINTATRRSVRAGIAFTAGAVALTAGLAACSTVKQLTAGEKVSGAFQKLTDAKSMKIELSVDATSDQLVAFGKAIDDPIEKKNADLLSDLTLSISMSSDKPLKDSEAFKNGYTGGANAYDLKGVAIGYALSTKKSGKTYADLRLVDGKMYVKADVRGIAGLMGEDTSKIDEAMSALPPEAAPIKDVVDGKWLALDMKKFEELTGGSAKAKGKDIGRGAVPEAMPSIDPSAIREFTKSLKDALADNVTLEDKGKSGDADLIRVSAPARPLVKAMTKSVESLTASIPGYPALPSGEDDLKDVPDRNFSADVLIKNGKAQAVTFDLAQFDDKLDPSVHFPIRLAFSNDAAPLTAPAGASELDLTKFQEAFAAMAGSGQDFGDDADFDTTPGTPLTASQYAELAKLGVDRQTAERMNKSGLEFEQIKQIASASTDAPPLDSFNS
ncbi:hypothetical protein [Streptomyces sp. TLI_171]|uniref:hypothetical protein n=1 Tax=Streptomyces sp. TLI_171 TaxID=1938859 RepID=UPI0011809C7E|nr:hypothetical protein [Streptomyces sp. TLI_171]